MNISIPTLEKSYKVLQDVWIETITQATKPVEKYLIAKARLLPIMGKRTSFMGKSYGARLYKVAPIRKILLKAGDIIQIFNLYPAKEKTHVGFEFKLIRSDSPIIAAGSLTVWKAALNPLLSLEDAVVEKMEGKWVNHVSSRVISVENLFHGKVAKNGLWASYVDALEPSQNFDLLMGFNSVQWDIGTPSRLVEVISPNGERNNKTLMRPGVLFPLIKNGYRYLPKKEQKSWVSCLGNHCGLHIPYHLDQKINFDHFVKDYCLRSKVVEKQVKRLFDRYGCIPDGYFPFLYMEGHKFEFSYIPAEVLVLGGFIDKTSSTASPINKKEACFPFENGKLSFHTNIIKFKSEKK